MEKGEGRVLSKRINISITPKELHKVWKKFFKQNRASFDSFSGMIKFAMKELMEKYGFNWKEELAKSQNPLGSLELGKEEE